MKKKYSIKKHGRMFKIYEHLTQQYIAQSKSKNVLTKLLRNLNKGGFFAYSSALLISDAAPIQRLKSPAIDSISRPMAKPFLIEGS